MVDNSEPKRHGVDFTRLQANYPTHLHPPEFWEALGRTVATYGFLEEALGKAIFAFTGMREVPEEKIEEALERWLPTLEKALSDALGSLIEAYGKAVRAHGGATITNLDELLSDLREATVFRNVICHGSWRSPDADGKSLPFFVDRRLRVFDTPIGIDYLNDLQRSVLKLTCDVINTVTHMGWQFPGSGGPGKIIYRSRNADAL